MTKAILSIFFFGILVYFIGCQKDKTIIIQEERHYKTVLIDSCEYIETYVYGGYYIIHKENCKNHRLK